MTRVLLDTQIALWALGEPARLSAAERAVLVDPAVDLAVLTRDRTFAAYGVRLVEG